MQVAGRSDSLTPLPLEAAPELAVLPPLLHAASRLEAAALRKACPARGVPVSVILQAGFGAKRSDMPIKWI